MTLLETERLIRRMCELLQSGGNAEVAPKLASDYAATCHAANLRLQQCEAMIKAGDRPQAIQLAETAPNLLDLITLLEFREADGWRAYCQEHSLPAPERIDARAVRTLNDTYGQGITTDHPLYADYRKAVLLRDEVGALKILQSITRLNPGDANAASELNRLDAKVLNNRIEHLGAVTHDGDPALVTAEVEAIEGFGFKTRPGGEIWSRAQTARCEFVLEAATQAKAAGQWTQCLAQVELIRRLQKDLRLEFSPPTREKLEAVESWAGSERDRDHQDREFRALLSELRFRVEQSQEKDTASRQIELPEMRDDYEALHKIWRSLTDFTRPIPDDVTAAFRKRSALLEGEIARRVGIRRRTMLLSTAAALVVGVVVVWFVLGRLNARTFAGQLQAAVSQRQTRVAERLLERVRGDDKKLAGVPGVNAAIAAADSFVTAENARLANFNTAFGRLPAKLEGAPEAPRLNAIADQLAQTRAALDALAPDLKAENEPRLNAFDKDWQQYLSQSGVAVNDLLEQLTADAEKQSAQLDYRSPTDTAASRISGLSVVMQKINEIEGGYTNRVDFRGDLLQRASVVQGKLTAYQSEMRKIDEGMAALQHAATYDEFSAAITSMASSEFSGAPATLAATAVQSLGPGDESALRALLGAANAGTWAFIRKSKPASLVPEVTLPAEREAFEKLNDDPAVKGSHQHYRLWLDRDGTTSVEWITGGTLESSPGWKHIDAWTLSATERNATFDNREYGNFDGQKKLSPTQPIYRLEQLPEQRETSAFANLGIDKVWLAGDTYGGPLLEVMDRVKDSPEGSPIFRAYLICYLVNLMEFQPDAWGLSFCPSARADAARIREIAGGEIASGDWFVPAKIKAWNDGLARFFETVKSQSYTREAAANLALARAVAKDGIGYAGFADLNGKLVIAKMPVPSELWGYVAKGRPPTLISNSAMPLSPLFALPSPRSDYFAKAGIAADAQLSTNALPPLFRARP